VPARRAETYDRTERNEDEDAEARERLDYLRQSTIYVHQTTSVPFLLIHFAGLIHQLAAAGNLSSSTRLLSH
jgi:hypothetical protein